MSTTALNLTIDTELKLRMMIYSLAYVLPICLAHPQWLTGTLVNCWLFLAAEKLDRRELWPVLVLPSLGALSRGWLFGSQTVFLFYFLPFIWVGNYVLVAVFRGLAGRSWFTRVGWAALVKFGLLALAALIYWRLGTVPSIFKQSMGLMQLVTALAGGAAAWLVNRSWTGSHE